MKVQPLITIIINNYNYGRYLGETIDSAINQSYKNLEIIVVDDGSTDNSQDVIKSFGSHITPFFKENGGQPSAFNSGFRLSKGEVICFLDSDDHLSDKAVEIAIEYFNSSDVVNVHWPLWEIDQFGNKTGSTIPESKLAEGNLLEDVIRNGPKCYTVSPSSGNAWARKYIEKVYPIRDLGNQHGGDAYLSILAPLFGQIKRVDLPLGCYRIHSSNFSGRRGKRKPKLFAKQCKLLCEYLHQIGIAADPFLWIKNFYSCEYSLIKSVRELRNFFHSEFYDSGSKFILVEDGCFQREFMGNKNALPFLEKDGKYWGYPADDATAIHELERMRQSGACLIAFLACSFWWLSYYSGLNQYLRTNYRCVRENEHIKVFGLER